MANEDDVAIGLIDWINSLEVDKAVQSVSDLNDGETLWKVLRMLK